MTVSHLRFSANPVRETYQVQSAQFVACHQFQLLERMAVFGRGAVGKYVPAEQSLRTRRGLGSPTG